MYNIDAGMEECTDAVRHTERRTKKRKVKATVASQAASQQSNSVRIHAATYTTRTHAWNNVHLFIEGANGLNRFG